ncbi:hypothetical protein BH23PLA1_BH23PLA1_37400 [soil metagenome]
MSTTPRDREEIEELRARCRELEAQLAERPAPAGSLPPFELRALRLLEHGWGEGWELRPSPARRYWMDDRPHSYHCLPMVVANQWGWQVLCPTDLRVVWDGSAEADGLWVEVDPQYAPAVKSQFGAGIVTFSPPWLFRTPEGWDLYAKGPGNRWKPNCVPLEGVIETWWLPYTFTLNWKLVEPGEVPFRKGESLGQLLPVPHGTFEGSRAVEESIKVEPELEAELLRWRAERRRRAISRHNTHQYYRKAEDVADHHVRVPVPPVHRVEPDPGGQGHADQR